MAGYANFALRAAETSPPAPGDAPATKARAIAPSAGSAFDEVLNAHEATDGAAGPATVHTGANQSATNVLDQKNRPVRAQVNVIAGNSPGQNENIATPDADKTAIEAETFGATETHVATPDADKATIEVETPGATEAYVEKATGIENIFPASDEVKAVLDNENQTGITIDIPLLPAENGAALVNENSGDEVVGDASKVESSSTFGPVVKTVGHSGVEADAKLSTSINLVDRSSELDVADPQDPQQFGHETGREPAAVEHAIATLGASSDPVTAISRSSAVATGGMVATGDPVAGKHGQAAGQPYSGSTPADDAKNEVEVAKFENSNTAKGASKHNAAAKKPALDQRAETDIEGVKSDNSDAKAKAAVRSASSSPKPANLAFMPELGERPFATGLLPEASSAHSALSQIGATTPVFRAARSSAQDTPTNLPVRAIALHIAAKMANGARTFQIRLDPPELGRIDVRLEIGRDGQVNAQLTVDKPETLDALQRDQRSLERTLQNAGLETKDGGLSFNLRQDAETNDEDSQKGDSASGEDGSSEGSEVNDAGKSAAAHYIGLSALDIRV